MGMGWLYCCFAKLDCGTRVVKFEFPNEPVIEWKGDDVVLEGIIQNLKKRLEVARGKWPEELPGVLWAYRTTAKSSTRENPFSLVYRAEALNPVEVGELTLRYFQASEEAKNEAMLVNLELLDERRDLEHMVAQKHRIERYYNQRTNLCYFKVGDLVIRKVTQNTRELNAGKLDLTWEGPCRVLTITRKGSYELENQDGEKLPSNWNEAHLKRYYS
ncbi:uncharacterized protein [Nicotiana tomentosiformis]|uniref:uncharacterized protein n=1 Tax=Nicotiana tomentosiformis TaxID=4098 RepID=UPI00388CAABC